MHCHKRRPSSKICSADGEWVGDAAVNRVPTLAWSCPQADGDNGESRVVVALSTMIWLVVRSRRPCRGDDLVVLAKHDDNRTSGRMGGPQALEYL